VHVRDALHANCAAGAVHVDFHRHGDLGLVVLVVRAGEAAAMSVESARRLHRPRGRR
jgi:hypothetical protein